MKMMETIGELIALSEVSKYVLKMILSSLSLSCYGSWLNFLALALCFAATSSYLLVESVKGNFLFLLSFVSYIVAN